MNKISYIILTIMLMKNAKNVLYSHKTVILGLAFVLLMVIFFCGHIQAMSHSAGAESAECNKTSLIATNTNIKDSALLFLFLFPFIISTLLIKNGINNRKSSDASFRPSLIFLKVAQLISKLYNPILEALRRGILHPQIYNFAPISS